jgi:hypothetical protein
MEKTIELPAMQRAAEVRASSFEEGDNSIEIIWTTGAKVRRYDWWNDKYYDEELAVSGNNVRLGRLNVGAPFLNTHASYDLRDVIGAVVPGSARLEGGKGYARVALSRAAGDADTVQKIKDGIIRNISVGYRVHKVEKTEGEEGDVALWRVVDWEPLELSAVPIPADPGAQIRSDGTKKPADGLATYPCVVIRADASPEPPTVPTATPAETEGAPAMSDRAATAADQSGVTTEARAATPAAPAVDPAAIRAEAVAAERGRTDEIRNLAAKVGLRDFGDEHIRNGATVEAFRIALIDEIAARATKPNKAGVPEGLPASTDMRVYGANQKETRAAAIAEALLHRHDAVAYPLSDRARDFRGMSLLEIARDCLETEGISTRGMSRNEIAAQALAASTRSVGLMSTSDFPLVLANVANKTLRAAYEQAPQTFRPIVRVTSVPDFKSVSRVQLGEAPAFERVNEHGEFKRGTMGEGREQYAITTFGKIVGITRQTIINDDLSAFTRIPAAFGMQAANLESDLVWSQITGNPNMADGVALFHANHGNLGTAAGITADSVALGREAMRIQKGLDNTTLLNIMPKYIIAPAAAENKALQLLAAITPNQTSQVVVEYIRNLSLITEPRLDGGIVDPVTKATIAGSRFVWFLAADPSQIDMIELAYLEGNQGVYTETRTGFDVDGVEIKVRLDAGAKAIDWRGFWKNPATGL